MPKKQSYLFLHAFDDINSGLDGSFPEDFTEYGGNIYFQAYTEEDGYELYRLDRRGNVRRSRTSIPAVRGRTPPGLPSTAETYTSAR
jgi:hypothetical protein